MTDASGAVVGEQRYYPYGETRVMTGSMFTDKLFTGQREMAGLGIYHYGARFYSPKLGRFISADTIVPGAANPQAFNRYSYVLNNPLRYTDPTGHMVADFGGGGGKKCTRNCGFTGFVSGKGGRVGDNTPTPISIPTKTPTPTWIPTPTSTSTPTSTPITPTPTSTSTPLYQTATPTLLYSHIYPPTSTPINPTPTLSIPQKLGNANATIVAFGEETIGLNQGYASPGWAPQFQGCTADLRCAFIYTALSYIELAIDTIDAIELLDVNAAQQSPDGPSTPSSTPTLFFSTPTNTIVAPTPTSPFNQIP